MAEALIQASTGHVIDVKPDKHPWGDQECLPRFHIVKVPGATVESLIQYFEPKIDPLQSLKGPKIVGLRAYAFDQSKFDPKGILKMTLSQFHESMRAI